MNEDVRVAFDGGILPVVVDPVRILGSRR